MIASLQILYYKLILFEMLIQLNPILKRSPSTFYFTLNVPRIKIRMHGRTTDVIAYPNGHFKSDLYHPETRSIPRTVAVRRERRATTRHRQTAIVTILSVLSIQRDAATGRMLKDFVKKYS